MLDLVVSIVALVVAFILAIVTWTIAYLEYRKLVKQRKIDCLIKRIRERAEDSGNESDGDTRNYQHVVDMGNIRLLDVNDS
uniref:Protein Vpu n=1 Tax=Human immunodeficiency virus type 1 TaxID=11676 RepID=A0A0A0UYK9_HV1|nr:vpu protein [Human immunodeficiency virus 1]